MVVGASGAGKSALLADLGRGHNAHILNVGSELGRRLATRPVKQRALAVPTILRDLADDHAAKNILLLDNIELLFDRTLRLDPLDLLKQLARARCVVAAWPGQLRDGRLKCLSALSISRREGTLSVAGWDCSRSAITPRPANRSGISAARRS